MRQIHHFDILENSQVFEARQTIARLAGELNFDENKTGKLSIAVSEAATNIIKHGKGGEILIRSVTFKNIEGLEILALDRGKGITDLSSILKDGFSTTGTLGIGIGAIRRASTLFDIYTQPERGTALLFRMWSKPLPYPLPPRPLEIGIVSLPKRGEEVSGDGWFVEQWENRSILSCIDGLGHGILAEEVTRAAIDVIRDMREESPGVIMEKLHRELRHSRGAAIAIADFRFEKQELRFCGVGNISARLVSEGITHFFPSNQGTIGYMAPKIKELSYHLPSPDSYFTFTMHSDGLSEHWKIEDYPGLTTRHPSLVSGVLYRDFNKQTDDVTVISARIRRGNFREP